MEDKMEKYPKFKSKEECAFTERDDCNYGEEYDRCPFMKYNKSKNIFDPTRWECTFKKEDAKDNTPTNNKRRS